MDSEGIKMSAKSDVPLWGFIYLFFIEFIATFRPSSYSFQLRFFSSSLSALKYMYLTYPKLWGEYGLKDSFDLDTNWYSNTYYGIGVAMIALPIENFRSGFIWKEFMKNKYVKDALKKAGFRRK